MGRLLLLAVAVFVLVWLVRRALRPRPADTAERVRAAADLVACAHCGVMLPRAEAHEAPGGLFCGAAHARLGPRRP
jgi:uncharacterized protein